MAERRRKWNVRHVIVDMALVAGVVIGGRGDEAGATALCRIGIGISIAVTIAMRAVRRPRGRGNSAALEQRLTQSVEEREISDAVHSKPGAAHCARLGREGLCAYVAESVGKQSRRLKVVDFATVVYKTRVKGPCRRVQGRNGVAVVARSVDKACPIACVEQKRL
jgi:hypothetical protein